MEIIGFDLEDGWVPERALMDYPGDLAKIAEEFSRTCSRFLSMKSD